MVAALANLVWALALAEPAMSSGGLSWRAPAGCPDAAQVTAQIEAHLHAQLDPDRVAVQATVTGGTGGEYHLALEITRFLDGRTPLRDARELRARDCETLGGAAALVVALGVDAVAVARAEITVKGAATDVPLSPTATDVVRAEPTLPMTDRARPPRPTAKPRWYGLFALAGGVEYGAVPGPSGGIDAALGGGRPGLRVELGGTWIAPRQSAGAIGAVRVQLGTVAVRVCPELGRGRVRAPVCLGIAAGAMRGSGVDVPGAQTVHAAWVAPTVSAGVRVTLAGPLALLARAEVAAAVTRPAFELREPGAPISVFRPPPVSTRLWLGVELRARRRDGKRP